MEGGKTMLFINNWRRWTAITIGLVGLVMLLALWGGSPGRAQETVSFVFEKIHVRYQSVEVRDAEGTVLGSGDFQATVSNNRNDRTSGKAVLQMPDFTLEIAFTKVDEILYMDDNPVGVVLSGRGTLNSDGHTETFAATVRVEVETSLPDCLIWDIPGAPVIESNNFDTEGTLRFREQ
jgi:hypothetical protein